MIKNALVLMVVVTAAVGAIWGAVGLLLPSTANATEHSATRSFSPETVLPGGDVVVTIEASGYGAFGGVVETLPPGFTYKSSSRPASGVKEEGQKVTFALFGETSFTYTVTASSVEQGHAFSGSVKDDQGEVLPVGGTSIVTVEAEATTAPDPGDGNGDGSGPSTTPNATRSFAPETVLPGGDVVVTIEASGYGAFGGVVETLPPGFTYKSSSRPASGVKEEGQKVTFALFGETSFTYTVTASSVESAHPFSGILKDDQGVESAVGGATSLTVEVAAAPEGSATRSFSPEPVRPGGDVVVTIEASGYGQFGGVVETLPPGFTYKSSSRPASGVKEEGQKVTFALFGETSFTYTVTASSVESAHPFSGILKDDQGLS